MATEKTYYATGKRKNAIARTWIQPGTGVITVNERPADEYFVVSTARTISTVTINVSASFSACGGRISQKPVSVTSDSAAQNPTAAMTTVTRMSSVPMNS